MKQYLRNSKQIINSWLHLSISDAKTVGTILVVSVFIFFLVRQIIGIDPLLVYALILFFILLKVSPARISAVFFVISIISIFFGRFVEGNYYFSFSYIFLSISVLQQVVRLIIENRKSKV